MIFKLYDSLNAKTSYFKDLCPDGFTNGKLCKIPLAGLILLISSFVRNRVFVLISMLFRVCRINYPLIYIEIFYQSDI